MNSKTKKNTKCFKSLQNVYFVICIQKMLNLLIFLQIQEIVVQKVLIGLKKYTNNSQSRDFIVCCLSIDGNP